MATTPLVMKTGFSYDKMLELSCSAARKYFVMDYFLPAALSRLAGSDVAHLNTLVMLWIHRTKQEGLYRPVLMCAQPLSDGNPSWEPKHTTVIPNNNNPLGDFPHQTQFERVEGISLDHTLVSKAIKYAFEECFALDYIPTSAVDSPLIATVFHTIAAPVGGAANALFNAPSVVKNTLNVVCKTRTMVYRETALTSQICTRGGLVAHSSKYSQRAFNSITGEWIGLCQEGSTDCCIECKAIYDGKARKNAYHDEEVASVL